MVAWQSNPTLGALIADMGPYLSADWPAMAPPLSGRFPVDAGEIDYYVFDPATTNYLTMNGSPSGPYSDSYSYVSGGVYGHSAYTGGGGTGAPPAGAHIYVVWYDTAYNTVPAAPSKSPESLTLSTYSAIGTLAPPVFHWGPWVTPAPQTFTFSPGSGRAGLYSYTVSATSIADAIAHPGSESPGSATWLWYRDMSGPGATDEFLYSIGTIDVSTGLTQYAKENSTQGFLNASPALPSGAVAVQQETTWDHTHYAEMLASVIGDITFSVIIQDRPAGAHFTAEDVNILVWTEPSSALTVTSTTFGEIGRTAGPPTQADLNAAYVNRTALASLPATSSSTTVTFSLPVASLYTGLLPYRDDLSPSVRVSAAIYEGVVGTDPVPVVFGDSSGRELGWGGFSVTATYAPPRYRFQYSGPPLTTPPVRQLQRGDTLAGGAPRQLQTGASAVRQGPGRIR